MDWYCPYDSFLRIYHPGNSSDGSLFASHRTSSAGCCPESAVYHGNRRLRDPFRLCLAEYPVRNPWTGHWIRRSFQGLCQGKRCKVSAGQCHALCRSEYAWRPAGMGPGGYPPEQCAGDNDDPAQCRCFSDSVCSPAVYGCGEGCHPEWGVQADHSDCNFGGASCCGSRDTLSLPEAEGFAG